MEQTITSGALFENFMEQGFKFLFVDIDDTLYSYERAHCYAIEKLFETQNITEFGLTLESFIEEYVLKRREVKVEHKNSGVCRSRYLAFYKLFNDLGIKNAFLKSRDAEEEYWSFLMEGMLPYNEIINFLVKINYRGVRICVISDMQTRIQIEKLKKLGLVNIIDHIVTSEDVNVEKPSARIYDEAVKIMNATRKSCLMLGDDYEKDILGALNCGISAWQVVQSGRSIVKY